MISTVLIMRWKDGAVTRVTPHVVTDLGWREGYVSAPQVTSEKELYEMGSGLIESGVSSASLTTTVTIQPHGDSDKPYFGFGVGDWVLIPDDDETAQYRRVQSITVTTDDDGVPLFVLELGTIPKEIAERVTSWLTSMVPGTLGGTIRSASLRKAQ